MAWRHRSAASIRRKLSGCPPTSILRAFSPRRPSGSSARTAATALTAASAARLIPFSNLPVKPGTWWARWITSWASIEIKAGGELRRHRLNFLQAGAPNGLFAFTSSGTASGTAGVGGDVLAALMIGYVDNGFTEYEIPPFTSTQNYQIGGFVQDNWRVTSETDIESGIPLRRRNPAHRAL